MSATVKPSKILDGQREDHILCLLCHSRFAAEVADKLTGVRCSTKHYRTIAAAAIGYTRQWQQPAGVHLTELLAAELNKGDDTAVLLHESLQRIAALAEQQNHDYELAWLDEHVLFRQRDDLLATARDKLNKGDVAGYQDSLEALAATKLPQPLPVFNVMRGGLSEAQMAALPRDQFVYGLLGPVGTVSVLHGRGASGKSTYLMHGVVQVASGREVLGEPVYLKGAACGYALLEDDSAELQKLLTTCQQFHRIGAGDLASLHLWSGDQAGAVVVAELSHGKVVATAQVDSLITWLRFHAIKLFAVDSFIKTHRCEGNDNGQMGQVMEIWCRIAREAACAVVLAAHDNKGDTGNVQALRGAGAISDHARAVLSLRKMTVKEAEDFAKAGDPEFDPEDYQSFVCIGPEPKMNRRKAPREARWFQMLEVALPNGDHRPALLRWYPPDTSGVTLSQEQEAEVIAAIHAGLGDGVFYSPHRQAKERWVGHLLAQYRVKPDKGGDLVRRWLSEGEIAEGSYWNSQGNAVACLR